MSDNNDFEDDDGLDDTFDDFSEDRSKKGESWKDKPAAKVGIAVAALVLIFLVINMFSSSEEEVPVGSSSIGTSSTVNVAPGVEEASPAYVQALEEENDAVREEAEATGTSAIPVPIEPPRGIISVPDDEADAEDPLQRWRRLQEERMQQEIRQRETINVVTTQDVKAQAEIVAELSELMQDQMASILEARPAGGISSLSVTDPAFLEALKRKEEGGDEDDGGDDVGGGVGTGPDGGSASLGDEFEEEIIQETLMPAGEVSYAQLLTAADTDAPGPVLAEIVSGPLKGNRIIGRFREQNELLTLTFDTIVIDEESIGMDGIALDPDTTLPALATDVDHRYLQRILLPAAAAFIEGLSSAMAEGGQTNITIDTGGGSTATTDQDLDSEQEVATGVAEAGQELRTILDEMSADTEVRIQIKAGTPIGILFLEPVVTQDQFL